MRTLRARVLLAGILTLAAACGGGDGADGAAAAGADSGAAAAADSVPASEPVPVVLPPQADRAPDAEPTAADSAAAVAQDVSPEWIQRSREMASYDDCMRQAGAAPPPVRPRLEQACRNLPTAPRR